MRKALIFDLDGTLWDASAQITESWRIVGVKHFGPGYQLSVDKVQSLMGKTMDEIGRALTPENADLAVAKEFVAECFSYETEYLQDHPGVLFPEEVETLEELREDFDLYIVSNCQSGYIETFLPIVPHGTFLDHKCWSDTQQEKHVTIRLLMDLHGIKDAIYIGDTEKDEKAANLAGIPFILAGYGFGTAHNPVAVASSFADLLRVLRAL